MSSAKVVSNRPGELSKAQQAVLMQNLQTVSGEYEGWQVYAKGATVLFECDNPEKASLVADKLEITGACESKVMHLKSDSRKLVVQVTNIDYTEMMKYTSNISIINRITSQADISKLKMQPT